MQKHEEAILERVTELRAWAANRIRVGDENEKHTLRAVLSILDGE